MDENDDDDLDEDADEESDEDEDDDGSAATTVPRRSAAEILFGDSPTNDREEGAERMPTETRSVADRLFGAQQPAARAQPAAARPIERRKRPEEILFGDTIEQSLNIDENLAQLADREGLTAEQVAAEKRSHAQLTLGELRLDTSEANKLHGLQTEYRLKKDDPAWTEQAKKWPEQSRRRLREGHGQQAAERLQAEMHTFIDARPALAKTLEGIRDHPEVTQMLVGPVRRVTGL